MRIIFLVLLLFSLFTSCTTKYRRPVEWDIPDYVRQDATKFDAVFIDEKCQLFIRMERVFISGFPAGPLYWDVINDAGIKYTMQDGEGNFEEDELEWVREYMVPSYKGAIYVIPVLGYGNVEDRRHHWGYEVYYCKYSDAYFFVCNYYNGRDTFVVKDTVALFHNIPPVRIRYYIRVLL